MYFVVQIGGRITFGLRLCQCTCFAACLEQDHRREDNRVNILGYVRVSTDAQDTDRQVKAIEDYAALHDLRLVDVIREELAVSGRARSLRSEPAEALAYYTQLARGEYAGLERSGYSSLLERVDEGGIDSVAIYAVDRISRDWIELGLLELLLSVRGTRIIAVNQGGVVDTTTAAGKLQYRLAAILATHECDQTAERTSATLRHKVKAWNNGTGRVHVGRPPVGWRKLPNGQIGQDPDIWPRVVQVRQLRGQGMTYKQIEAATNGAVKSQRVRSYLRAHDWTPPAADCGAGTMPFSDRCPQSC